MEVERPARRPVSWSRWVAVGRVPLHRERDRLAFIQGRVRTAGLLGWGRGSSGEEFRLVLKAAPTGLVAGGTWGVWGRDF